MANTMTLIASSTVSGATAANMTFTSIPSTYTDLLLKISARIGDANTWSDFLVSFNGTTTNYSDRFVYGAGASTGTGTDTGAGLQTRTSTTANTANTFGNTEMYIPNYTGSNYKSASYDQVSENNATGAIAILTAGLWSNTAAITSITLTPISSNNFVQYSTAYLYGIKNS
jgi:hypothetical protein